MFSYSGWSRAGWSLLVAGLLVLPGAAGMAKGPAKGEDVPDVVRTTDVPQVVRRLSLPRSVTLAELDNGLTILVQENHVAHVATVRCFVKNTGSAFEAKYLGAGLSHVLEHVVAGGTTTHRTEKEITHLVDTFGGATNAFTTNEMTAFFVDCPAKDTPMAIALVADSMQHITFEPKEFARELKVVRRELADGEVNRSSQLFELLEQTLYTTSPARHPVIGYLEVLNKTTNQAIIDFYHQRYVPQNQVFVVVGDVRTQDVLDQVAQQWKGTTRGYETAIALPDEPEQLAPREALREMDGSTYDIALAWPTVPLASKDLYALDVAAYILGEGESSRLVQDLKYDKQLVLSVNSASETPHYVRGWFGVFAVAQPAHWQAAERALRDEVYRLRDALVDPAELARAKKQKAAELVFGRQTVQQAADSLGRNYITTADPLFDTQYVAGIEKVTAEEIRDVARRYFVPERLNRAIIAPPGGAPKSRSEEAAAAEGVAQLTRLPNGLRVLIKRQPQLPLVNIQAFSLSGLLADTPQTAGRAALLAAMLDQGTATHSARQIAEYFDSIGAEFGMAAGRNTVYGSATVLAADFPAALALFAECFTRPTFPDDEFHKAQQLMLGAIARRADDPHAEATELYYDALPAGSPYHILEGGTADTVQRLTPADLRAYHARYFVPNNLLVTVYGDVDPKAALALVQQHFGQLQGDPQFQHVDFQRPNALPADVVRHKKIAKPTGMVVLGFPEVSIFDEKDYAALTVLNTVMAGYSYPGGWLHEELRGEGLVYWVHANQMTGPAPGYFTIMAQTRPDKVDEVVARIRKNVEKARSGSISPDEFATAKQTILALHAQQDTTIAAQARMAALDELYGLGYEYDKRFDARIQAVTLDEVIGAARKYLTHSVLVTTSPDATQK